MTTPKLAKRVQQRPFTFQDWWDRQEYGVEHFKPCRDAWNAALKTVAKPGKQP